MINQRVIIRNYGYILLYDSIKHDVNQINRLFRERTLMQKDIEKVLFYREQIAARVAELGREITADLERLSDDLPEVVLVPILTGSIVFVADLIRYLPQKLRIGVVSVSSYPGKSLTSKGVSIRSAMPKSLLGKHVLIIDDILDSGQTIQMVKSIIMEQNPATLWTCVMLRKDIKNDRDVVAEYVGFDIPDEFVVGYGLDYNDYYRNLPDIVTLRREIM